MLHKVVSIFTQISFRLACSNSRVFGLKNVGWCHLGFVAMVTFLRGYPGLEQVLLWVRNRKPKLDQSEVTKVTYI